MGSYSYTRAMEAAGAKVIDEDSFGDWQGTWLALVEYNGSQFWVEGRFGSCSGCDSFKASFQFTDKGCEEHEYDKEETCPACQQKEQEYQQRLAEFGKRYLTANEWTQEEMTNEMVRRVQEEDWDDKPKQMLEFVLKHDPQHRTIDQFNSKQDAEELEEAGVPDFSEADKTRLQGLGVKGSKRV